MAPLTMMRVVRISLSRRGTTPRRASGGRNAMPLGVMISLHQGAAAGPAKSLCCSLFTCHSRMPSQLARPWAGTACLQHGFATSSHMLRSHNSALQRLCTPCWSGLHFAGSRSESRLPLSLSQQGRVSQCCSPTATAALTCQGCMPQSATQGAGCSCRPPASPAAPPQPRGLACPQWCCSRGCMR